MFEFKDGIYMLSLLRCLESKEILLENVQNFDFDNECVDIVDYNDEKNNFRGYKKYDKYDEYKESFTEPYQKLREKIVTCNYICSHKLHNEQAGTYYIYIKYPSFRVSCQRHGRKSN
jgi:hypothetical protein